MQSRLVPALAVVLVLVAPLAGVPAGAATADSGAAGPGGSATPAAAAQTSNTTSLPGVGIVADTAPAPDGGTYLVSTASPEAANLTVTRLAANGSVAWQRSLEAPNGTRAGQAVAATDDGVYVLEAVGPARGPEVGPTDGTTRLVHLAHDGERRWTRTVGDTYRGRSGDRLAADGDGVVLARPVPGDPPGTRLVRFTDDGDVEWNRSYDGGTPRALAVADDGSYLVAGVRGSREGWLLRVGPYGRVEQNRTYGGDDDRRVVGVVPTDDGGALLAGSAGARGFGWSDPWVARVDADGVPVWSRTYPAESAAPRAAVPTAEGVLLVHSTRPEFGPRGTRLTHVGTDGAAGALTTDAGRIATAARVADGTVRLYGAEFDRPNRTFVGTVDRAALPGVEPDDRETTPLASNTTRYRGQNLRFDGAADLAYGLYRLPGEYTEFDRPRLTRRLGQDASGSVAFETATLPDGRYAVRAGDGFWLELEDGQGAGITTDASAAAFELDTDSVRFARTGGDRRGPRLARSGPNRTVVETFRGERGVGVRVDTERDAVTARIGLTRLNGSSPDTGTLRAALSTDPGFAGTASGPVGDPYGTVRLTGDDRNLTLDAGALPAGFYRLSVAPLDTADATEPATTRLVVAREQREVSLTPAEESLTLSRGGEATTNLTLSGVDAGISAIRLEAARTGGPPVGLDIDRTDALDVGSASGGGGVGYSRASAESQSLAVLDAPDGTFTVARLTVRSQPGFARGDDPTTGTNTLTAEIAWLVDGEGVPYSVADPVTLRYEVTGDGEDGSDG